ncbi:MAG: PTS sugar transporter subunit IIA [Thermoguttaceae bacterium]|nr:PTS sugar transporter subunit IIA [Thermoguttaceae bacterium]MDW8038532.1 PTS sugar transporter subunit IIA [Thermoguttaceae bacterium]
MPHRDFDVASLARYLHISPEQVLRLAERGKIPGRKVAGQWRFSRAEIHHWLEEKIGAAEDDAQLAQLETVVRHPAAGPSETTFSSLTDLMPLEAIAIPLPAKTRNSVVSQMVQLAAGTGLLWDPQTMVEAVLAREAMYPTALENGVALLHPRRPMPSILAQPLLCLGITPSGVPFGGPCLTDIFFLICSVDDPGHLRVLTRLSRVIGRPEVLDALRAAPDAASARQVIQQAEAEI